MGREIKAQVARSYYECWLAALERLVEEKRLMSEAERLARIDAWDRAAKATPHGQPIEVVRGVRDEIRERVRAGLRTAEAQGKALGRPRRAFWRDEAVRLRSQGRELAKNRRGA